MDRNTPECLSMHYFDIGMVCVTRLYDYGSRNLGSNLQLSDSVGFWITFIYPAIFIYLKINFSLNSLLICPRPTLYLKIKHEKNANRFNNFL